jgi:hypothetical protein
MATKPVRKKNDMAKAKKGIWNRLFHRSSSNSKEARWKRWIWRHKKSATAVAAIIICVGVLAVCVPNKPSAMTSVLVNNGLSLSVSGPTSATVGTNVKYTMKLTNTTKKAISGTMQFQPGQLIVGSCGGCKITAGTPDKLAAWDFSSIKPGSANKKTITITLKYTKAGTWAPIWTTFRIVVKNKQIFVTVKAPPPPPTRPGNWTGYGCLGYNTPGTTDVVCNYNYLTPFLITGKIKGPGTLTYRVQCQNQGLVSSKVLFSKSLGVKGNIKIYGVKAAEKAGLRCASGSGKGPALTVILKLGKGASSGSVHIRLDEALPWGK